MQEPTRGVVALTDFGPDAEPALLRAALLARQLQAPLSLIHLAGGGPPDVAERLPRCAAMLARRHRLPVSARGPMSELELRRSLPDLASLVVLGEARSTRRFGWARPTLAQRLARRAPCPLLVVRQQGGEDYRRALVALAGQPEPAAGLLQAAAALAPEAELELFHAMDTRHEALLRAAEASPQSLRRYRTARDHQARQLLLRVSDGLQARRNRLMHTLGRGDPVRQILVQQQYGQADLVVVGQRLHAWWAAWLQPASAVALLAELECDLLVWPDARP